MHAEHLGHFLALQSVPETDPGFERALFLGLSNLFTRDTVLSRYKRTLIDQKLRKELLDRPSMEEAGRASADDTHPKVFVNFQKHSAAQIVSLLRELLKLFDVGKLCSEHIMYKQGEEPEHMLFLYTIQLMATFVSKCMEQKDLATIMSLASAPFLEANFCNPLCAATLLKPMFIPKHKEAIPNRNGESYGSARNDPPLKPEYYTLFTGYNLADGQDVSGLGASLGWTASSIQQSMRGYRISERGSNELWFVAPQMGDRMSMVKGFGLEMLGGQADEKALKICSYLMSDNILAYMQCAVFGTISNMLPCHANSEFTEDVMTVIKGSMSMFSDVVRHQSASLMSDLGGMKNSCLYTAGVGFAGQYEGKVLRFGRVFTGTGEAPSKFTQSKYGDTTSVTLGIADNTMMYNMLTMSLGKDSMLDLNIVRTRYNIETITDAFFYARYHHRLNTSEFTEVARVRRMSDPNYQSKVHEGTLNENSTYQLTVSHGALPMCTLTVAMTIRQAVMMVMGFICAKLAPMVYDPKQDIKTLDVKLSNAIIELATAARFRHKNGCNSNNVFEACYGELVTLTGPVFSNPCNTYVNYHDLDAMEWLQPQDPGLPETLRESLITLKSTKEVVLSIMRAKKLSYNRILFKSGTGTLKFTTAFNNEAYMIHAPLMALSSLRVFTGNKSYGSVKLCRQGSYYPVKIFSNRCVDTTLYTSQAGKDVSCPTRDKNTTIAEMAEKIKNGVSLVLPKIHVDRIRMMNPELDEKQLALLVSAVKNKNIEVIGQEGLSYSSPSSCSTSSEMTTSVSPYRRPGLKRARDELCGEIGLGGGGKLTIFDTDVEFGFDCD